MSTPSPSLPIELITEIFSLVLSSAAIDPLSLVPGENKKPPWSSIASLSLASSAFRHVALSLWFRDLHLTSGTELRGLDRVFPDIKRSWCRNLHCVQPASSRIYNWNLSGFKRLSSICIDWLSGELAVLGSLENDVVPFTGVESPIEELEIRGVRYPSPMALSALSAPFKSVVVLRLDYLRMWCGLCHTCVLVRFAEPGPGGFVYEGGLGLPVHYARALWALDKLEEVHITLPDLGAGQPSHGLSATTNENLWAGECDRCMSLMYDDEAFRTNWVARKKGLDVSLSAAAAVGKSENSGSEAKPDPRRIYTKPPSLRKVRWNFWKFVRGETLGRGRSSRLEEEVMLDEEPFEEFDDADGEDAQEES